VSEIQLDSYRKIFTSVGLIGIMLFASPTIVALIVPPSGQQFSELYILGPSQTLDNIPTNVVSGVRYLVYLGVGNELGHSQYYKLYVKVGSQNDSIPNLEFRQPSNLPPLYEYNLFLQDGEKWQEPLTFEVQHITLINGISSIDKMIFNGIEYSIDKSSSWNTNKTGFYYSLIFELWIYNSALGVLQYHDRFVSLELNMTRA
jgi:uncharacterized membrane protein